MRLVLASLGLLLLGACAQPMQTASLDDNVGLIKFVEPVNGAAYSQADARYYEGNTGGSFGGPSGVGAAMRK